MIVAGQSYRQQVPSYEPLPTRPTAPELGEPHRPHPGVGADLLAGAKNRWRVIRTSNQYCFVDPQPPARPPHSSSFKFRTGPKAKTLFPWQRAAQGLHSTRQTHCTVP